MENLVLFRASWSLWQNWALWQAVLVTAPLIASWWPFVFLAPVLWWAAVRFTVLVAEVTRDELILQTPGGTRYVAIEDIRYIGRWYGTVWVRGRWAPLQFPWGRDRAALFDVLDDLRGSWTGTP